MSKREDSSNARCARKVMFGIILAGSVIPIAARAGTAFTWDPAGASPSLGGSAFTADAIQAEHYFFGSSPIYPDSAGTRTNRLPNRLSGILLAE
jgi:hypothetical protein